jgi:PEP-CTERM motif
MMSTRSAAPTRWRSVWAVMALGLAVVAQHASATIILASTRADILSSTTVEWSAIGPDFTNAGSPVSVGPATVSGASTYAVLQQAPTGSWNGNFADAESVLAMFDLVSGPVSGVFDINFASVVGGFATQAQDLLFGAFSVTLDVYGTANALLGSFNFNGDSNDNHDGSAIFIGVLSSQLDIARVVISGMGDGSAINHLTLGTAGSAPVPEPGTLSLALLALVALPAFLRARRRTNH